MQKYSLVFVSEQVVAAELRSVMRKDMAAVVKRTSNRFNKKQMLRLTTNGVHGRLPSAAPYSTTTTKPATGLEYEAGRRLAAMHTSLSATSSFAGYLEMVLYLWLGALT